MRCCALTAFTIDTDFADGYSLTQLLEKCYILFESPRAAIVQLLYFTQAFDYGHRKRRVHRCSLASKGRDGINICWECSTQGTAGCLLEVARVHPWSHLDTNGTQVYELRHAVQLYHE